MRPAQTIPVLLAIVAAGAIGYGVGRSRSTPSPHTDAPPPPSVPSVARWTGGALTAAELQARVVALKAAAGLPALDDARKEAFAERAIDSALLAAEARDRGLEGDARVAGPIAELLARRLLEVELEDPSKRPKPTDAEVAAWFEAHKDELVRPEQIHLAELTGNAPRSEPAARKKVRAMLEAARNQVAAAKPEAAPALFAELVKKSGDDPELAPRGGDLGALSQPDLEKRYGPEGAKAAWLMVGSGQLEIIESDVALHLVRLVARVPGRTTTLEAARPQIESRLWYERRDAELKKLLDALKSKRKLEVDEKALEAALADVK